VPDPAWPSSPPEVNHLRLVGAGAGGIATTLASGAAWQVVAATGEGECAVSAANAACTAPGFEGVGGAASAALAAGLNGVLQALAAWAQERTAIAAAGVAAFQTATSAMIPAAVSLANRAEQAADVAMNPLVFGALTPAIIALDTTYFGEYWPHNAAVGATYGAALAALTTALAVPPPAVLNGASTAGPTAAVAAVGETTARAVAGEATSRSSRLSPPVGTAPEAIAETLVKPLTGISTPVSSLGALSQPGMFEAPIQAIGGLAGAAESAPQPGGDELGTLGYSPALPAAGLPAISAIGPGGAVATAGGQVGAPAIPVVTPTTYAKPAAAFPPESPGRPLGLRSGEPLPVHQQGSATGGVGVLPASPNGRSRSQRGEAAVVHARVLLGAEPNSDAMD